MVLNFNVLKKYNMNNILNLLFSIYSEQKSDSKQEKSLFQIFLLKQACIIN